MKISTVTKLIASILISLWFAGCGGGGSGGGNSGGTAATPVVSKYTYSTKVYIAQKGSNDVRVINAPTDEELAKIPVGLGPVAVVVDDTVNKAYVANGGEKTISVIDTLTHKVASTITTADKPVDLAIDPANRRLYASLASNMVQVFNLDTQASMASVAVDVGMLRMAIDPIAKRLYVLGTGSIKVLNTMTNSVTATLPGNVGNPYFSIGINPKLKRLYVGGLTNATHIFDTTTNTEIAAPVINSGWTSDIFVNPNNDKVYVGSLIDTKVNVLDASGTLLTSIPTGSVASPERLVVNTRSNYLYAVSSKNELQITRLDGLLPVTSGTVVSAGSYKKNYSITSAPSALAIVKPSAPTPSNMPALPPAGGFGDSWKLLTANFNSVAFGNNLYVAVGDRGVIQTSPDGVNWTQRLSGVEASGGEWNLNKVIYAGGRFVVAGEANRILTSTDGITWTTAYSAGGSNLYGLAWSGTRYLAVGPDSMITSTDGITWTKSNAFAMTPRVTYLFDPVWYNNQFLISGLGMYTDFGSNGTNVSQLMNAQGTSYITNMGGGQSIANKPGTNTFVSVVSGTALQGASWQYTNNGLASPVSLSSVITITQDGGVTKFVPPEMARSDGNEWNMVTYNPVKNLYVAVGGAGGSRSAYIYQASRTYQTPAANGIIATSTDGVTWTPRTSPLPQALFGINHNTNTGEMIAVGEMGAIITSTDGFTWTARSGNTTSLPVSAGKLTAFNDVIWGGPGAGMFVAIGDAGALYTSVNGSNWTKIPVTTTDNFTAVTWGGLPGQQKFVATVQGSPWAYTSADGSTWTPLARPAATNGGMGGGYLSGVVWNGSKFFGTDLYDFYDSADGINWNFVKSHTNFVPSQSGVSGVRLRYDAQTKKFVFLQYWSAPSIAWGYVDYSTTIRTSNDTVTWSDIGVSAVGYRSDALFDYSGDSLLTTGAVSQTNTAITPISGESILTEAGSNGPIAMAFAPTKTAMSSGANHCVYYTPGPGSKYDCGYYGGIYTNRMVNTGNLMLGAGPGGIYTKSGTGLNWIHQPSGASYTSVAWNGSVFVAVGTNNIAVSR